MNYPRLSADGIRDEISCPFCGGDSFTPVTGLVPDMLDLALESPYRDMRFQMVKCQECHFNYQRIQPNPQDIGMFYDSEYFCYIPMSERGLIVNFLAKISAKSLVKKLRGYAPSDDCRLLDYGCGNGPWLRLLRMVNAPWRLTGAEIDPELVKQVQAAGFDAVVSTDADLLDKVDRNSVGIFFMNHVIEHIRSPLIFLEKVYQVLEPGGIVYGQTPDSECLEAKLFRDNWTQWHLPQHLVIFDKDSMKMHAERAGFEVVEISSSPSGATQWASSLLRTWCKTVGRPYRATKEPLHAWLTLLFAPLAVLQSMFSSSSHMDFVLRKTEKLA